jgi:hypothetical protein
MRLQGILAASTYLLVTSCSDAQSWSIAPGQSSDAGGTDAPLAWSPEAGGVEASRSPEAAPPLVLPPVGPVTLAGSPAVCPGGGAPQAYLLTSEGLLLAFDPPTLSTRVLGALSCPTASTPLAFAVTATGTGFVLFRDETLDEIDLASLACKATSYVAGQFGFESPLLIAAGAAPAADRTFFYGASYGVPALAFSDPSTFQLFESGPLGPAGTPALVDLKVDAYDRMFALANDGTFLQLDPATGAPIGMNRTAYNGSVSGTALLAWQSRILLLEGGTGNVSSYDIADNTLTPLGSVGQSLAAVAAAPCVSAVSSQVDAGTDAASGRGTPGAASAFAPGQLWIGTYACSDEVVPAALAVDSVSSEGIMGRIDVRVGASGALASYSVRGSFDATTREATFTAGGWLLSPPSNAPAVGFDGFASLSGTELSGDVTSGGCGAFSLQR